MRAFLKNLAAACIRRVCSSYARARARTQSVAIKCFSCPRESDPLEQSGGRATSRDLFHWRSFFEFARSLKRSANRARFDSGDSVSTRLAGFAVFEAETDGRYDAMRGSLKRHLGKQRLIWPRCFLRGFADKNVPGSNQKDQRSRAGKELAIFYFRPAEDRSRLDHG